METLKKDNIFFSSNVMKLADLIVTDNNERWDSWKTYNNRFFIVNHYNSIESIKKSLVDVKNIMVKIDYIHYFEQKIMPHITQPFNLITHLGDNEVNTTHVGILLNPLLLKWYGQNINFNHPKLTSLPIGIEDLYFARSDPDKLIELSQKKSKKKNLIYINCGNTHPSRPIMQKKLVDMGYKIFPKTDWKNYMDIIAASKFVFCPRGNGIDTHRFWETYAANSIPIILDEYYIERDFPDATVLVVGDVNVLTPEFLEEKYCELSENYNYDKKYLSIEYWKQQILLEERVDPL
tara:strand:+ start:77 stop:952 length:876 start_codon:yes stop_codon:yes gene_type:complete